MSKELSFAEIVAPSRRIRGLKVVLEWIGEGFDGDFDPCDPTDYPHLRFTVHRDGDALQDGSYCTALSAWAPRQQLQKAARTILAEAERTLDAGFKHAMEAMSWLGSDPLPGHEYEGHGYSEAA